jgi:hypothetical protein
MPYVDELDSAIVAHQQAHARQTRRELAQAVGIAPWTCLEQLRAPWARSSQLSTQAVQEPGHSRGLLDIGDLQAVNARSVSATVVSDPVERHLQHHRVVHEVEQVVGLAASGLRVSSGSGSYFGIVSAPAW